MGTLRSWLLPGGLAVAQLSAWPGGALLAGEQPDRVAVAIAVVATVLAAAALGWRRRAPLVVLGTVAVVVSLGYLGTPPDALGVIALGELVALYSVATHRSARLTLGATAVVVVLEGLLAIAYYDTWRGWSGAMVFVLTVSGLVAGLGRARRRWHAARADAAGRLARAEAAQQRAAGTERERLARELHDVSAHHMTSIVVTATAAERLADRRPELTGEALEFSARTARETLAALHRLMAVIRSADEAGPGSLGGRLAELADGFRRLGQPVVLDGDRIDVPSVVAEAAYGIAREALTNTLRHAPGGAVTVSVAVEDSVLVLVVDNEHGAGQAGVGSLGSGRGIVGMRERATVLGGTLDAGRRDSGRQDAGWRVRAALPLPAPRPSRPAESRRVHGTGRGFGSWLRGPRTLDTAIAMAVVVPLAVALAAEEEGPPAVRPATAVLLVLLMILHAVPLLWRRGRPWPVLAAVTGTSILWPAVAAYAQLPGEVLWVLPAGIGAEFAAVYAVAAYGRPRWATWLAAPAAATGLAVVLVTSAAADGSLGGEPVQPFPAAFLALWVAAGLVLLFGVAWGAGFAVRSRRERTLAREHDAVAEVTARAMAAARAERDRIATGLRTAVLEHAYAVLAAAERGRLDDVAAQARATLAAMRNLLSGLRAVEGE